VSNEDASSAQASAPESGHNPTENRLVTMYFAGRANSNRPYPFTVHATDGTVLHQDFWRGDPAAPVSFQDEPDVQTINRHRAQWVAGDLDVALGKYPVLVSDTGELWVFTFPVHTITVSRADHFDLKTGLGD
jgi:hypothetical protein